MKPIDSHCHLYFDQFGEDRYEVLERAKDELDFVVVAGCDPETNLKALELEKENPDIIKGNMGIHPTYTSAFDKLDEVKNQIREHDPVAIGEIGLDHHHVKKEELRERQEDVFREMLSLAEELQKPVVVHSREAEHRCVEIIDEYDLPDVMLHCFNGEPELAEEAVKKGYMIGVTTQILYSSRVKEILEQIPLENILLETDAPFLYPDGRNEPVKVLESAEQISELKDIDYSVVVEEMCKSSKRFFS